MFLCVCPGPCEDPQEAAGRARERRPASPEGCGKDAARAGHHEEGAEETQGTTEVDGRRAAQNEGGAEGHQQGTAQHTGQTGEAGESDNQLASHHGEHATTAGCHHTYTVHRR